MSMEKIKKIIKYVFEFFIFGFGVVCAMFLIAWIFPKSDVEYKDGYACIEEYKWFSFSVEKQCFKTEIK